MFKSLFCTAVLAASVSAMASPSLTDLIAQKRCTQVNGKPNAFDCMVDQPDGSVKKIRYLQAFNQKKKNASPKTSEEEGSVLPTGKEVKTDYDNL